jgi:ubiquinone biosynthesis protein Coq4
MLALIQLNVVLRRADLGPVFEAFSVGYQAGKQSRPLFGAHWDELFSLPLAEVRDRFAIDRARVVGEGIRAAA